MPSLKPSRQRERERRERERNAERPAGYAEREADAFKRLLTKFRSAPALDRAIAMLDFVAQRAGLDPGMPPEYRRQQVAQFSSQLGKLADPKKQLDEVGAELRTALGEIEEMERALAAQEHPRDPAGVPAATH